MPRPPGVNDYRLSANTFREVWLSSGRDAVGERIPVREQLALVRAGLHGAALNSVAMGLASGHISRAPDEAMMRVEAAIHAGRLAVTIVHRPRVVLQDEVVVPEWPKPEPKPDLDPIVDDDRLLRIVQCPALFDPRRESLEIRYLLRDLLGRPVELVIRSQARPEPPVHRRWLPPEETVDGPGTLSWDGRDDNTSELVERDLAPLLVELVHDERFCDQAATTLPPPPRAHFLEMKDLVFCTDREILLPQSLGALIVLVEFAREHPDKQLLVAGHTDTKGSDAHNLALSQRRAQNVQLWLTGDAEGWAAHCQKHFEIADFKAVHRWAHEHLGWATNPGQLDNEWHGKARVARDVFRSECEALLGLELRHHVAQNVADWQAIHDLYALIVARYLDLEPDAFFELRRSFCFTDPPLLACGEAFPRERAGEDGVASVVNRRVEVLFFDAGEVPDLSAEPPGRLLYGEKQYVFDELHPRHLDPLTPTVFEIDIQLVDHWHRNPLGGVAYSLSGPLPERLFHRQGATDSDGVLYEELLPSGYYQLRVGETTVVVMAHPVGFSDPNHSQPGPNFRDVYRIAGHGMSPVFPDRPSQADDDDEWVVPSYIPGPDREIGVDE